jgi:hypothetical protein
VADLEAAMILLWLVPPLAILAFVVLLWATALYLPDELPQGTPPESQSWGVQHPSGGAPVRTKKPPEVNPGG